MKRTIAVKDSTGKDFAISVGERFTAEDKIGRESYAYTGIYHGYEYCLFNLDLPDEDCETWITESWWSQRKIKMTARRQKCFVVTDAVTEI